MKNRYIFDVHALMKATVLFGFIALLLWLVNTYQLTLYINPRFKGLIEIAGWLLFPLAIIQTLSIVRVAYAFEQPPHGHSHNSRWAYIPFILVLMLAFALPGNTLNANLVNSKGLNSQLSTPASGGYEMTRPLASKLRQMSRIEVTDRDYAEIIGELQFFSQDYIGKEIQMTGFVFKPPEAANNQFTLVRYVVMCCTADALPYGMLCELKDAAKYKEGTWLTIKGVVQKTKYEDKTVPTLRITSLQQVPEPKEPYVFPPSQ
ncbi:MAG: TIGR03943 family protein [Negativicutes bacterium]|nr:TIGR03943 family protein [Negativicutes bacterium]